MKIYLKILVSFLLVLLLTSCPGLIPGLEEEETYIVSYNAGQSDSGYVPVDNNEYSDGDRVIVKGNTGNLTKNGSYFIGWSEYINGNSQYNQNDDLIINNADVILYAVWEEYPVYTVTYHAGSADSGNVPLDTNEYDDGDSVTIKWNTGILTKIGSYFSGWSDVINGTVVYNPDDNFNIDGSDVNLYAVWLESPVYIVTYDSGSADAGNVPIDTNEYYNEARVVVKWNTGNLTKSGSFFSGWSDVPNGSVLYYQNDNFYINESDAILYAIWSENPVYNVTFNSLDSDTPTTIIQSVTHPETTITSFLEDPIRTGFTFYGWAIDSNTDLTTDTEISEDLEVYATWTVNQYTVSFNSNGAESGNVPITTNHDYDSSITIPGNTGNLLLGGYTFKEWNSNFDGTGYSSLSAESFILGATDTIFYAIWSASQNLSTTISIPTGEYITFSDTLNVSITETLVVSIQEEFSTYTWYLDGDLLSGEESQSVSIVATDLYLGLHNLVAIVIDNNGVYSSGNSMISITE